MSRVRADLLLVLAAFIWGTAFIAQKNAGELMGPITFVGVRFLLSCAALAPLALYERRHSDAPLKKGDLPLAGLIGICVFAAAASQQVGLATTTATNGGFLTALYVVLVPVFVFAQTGVRPRQVVLVAGLGSIAGAWLLTDSAQLQSWTSGDALVLIADIAWAAGISLVPTFLARTNRPYFLAFAQFGVIGVLGAVVGLGGEPFSLEGLSAALPSIPLCGAFLRRDRLHASNRGAQLYASGRSRPYHVAGERFRGLVGRHPAVRAPHHAGDAGRTAHLAQRRARRSWSGRAKFMGVAILESAVASVEQGALAVRKSGSRRSIMSRTSAPK